MNKIDSVIEGEKRIGFEMLLGEEYFFDGPILNDADKIRHFNLNNIINQIAQRGRQ